MISTKKFTLIILLTTFWTCHFGQNFVSTQKQIPGKWGLTYRETLYNGDTSATETGPIMDMINYYEFKEDSTYILIHKDKESESTNSGNWRFITSENKILLYNSLSVKKDAKTVKPNNHFLTIITIDKKTRILYIHEDEVVNQKCTLYYDKMKK